jgi:hypothetical protein
VQNFVHTHSITHTGTPKTAARAKIRCIQGRKTAKTRAVLIAEFWENRLFTNI